MAKSQPSFEDSMTRLDTIVKALEGGNVPLAESMTLFEEGVGLVKRCETELDHAEKQIKTLTRTEDGKIAEVDFVPPDEGAPV